MFLLHWCRRVWACQRSLCWLWPPPPLCGPYSTSFLSCQGSARFVSVSASSPHTDIKVTGWISRLPPSLRPYALLARLDRPIGTWLLFLPGVWGILLPHDVAVAERVRLIILFGIGSLVMRAAGCVVNDMWDRDIDRQVARTAGRPLASGALNMRHAALFLARPLIPGGEVRWQS